MFVNKNVLQCKRWIAKLGIAMFRVQVFGLLLFGLFSCNSNDLEHSLTIAGANRSEMEMVLEHYKGKDVLKYKAACSPL